MTGGRTILVADDDRAIRTVLNQALGRLGYDVRGTGNAANSNSWLFTKAVVFRTWKPECRVGELAFGSLNVNTVVLPLMPKPTLDSSRAFLTR